MLRFVIIDAFCNTCNVLQGNNRVISDAFCNRFDAVCNKYAPAFCNKYLLQLSINKNIAIYCPARAPERPGEASYSVTIV